MFLNNECKHIFKKEKIIQLTQHVTKISNTLWHMFNAVRSEALQQKTIHGIDMSTNPHHQILIILLDSK